MKAPPVFARRGVARRPRSSVNPFARALRSDGGQALVEFALTLPVILMIILFTVDVGRLVYTYSAISAAAREGARLVSTSELLDSDCYAIQIMEDVGRGFPLGMDPNSIVGNSDPNNPSGGLQPSIPAPGTGLIYIWPAVSPAAPQETNCDGTQRGGSQTIRHVAVQVQYSFVPMTLIVAQLIGPITVKTISVVQVEY